MSVSSSGGRQGSVKGGVVRISNRRMRTVGLVGAAIGVSVAVLIAGLPPGEQSFAAPPTSDIGLEDLSGLSPEEVIGRGLNEDVIAELESAAEDRNELHAEVAIADADPVRVRAVDAPPDVAELTEIPTPVRSSRWDNEVVWPKPGRDEAGVVELSVARVAVELLDRASVATRGGAIGALLTPEPGAATARASRAAAVTLDYSGFAHAYGGDYGSRLRAVAFDPACFDDGCPGERLVSANDPVAGTVTADVEVASEGTLIVLMTEEEGPAGDYAATSLAPSGEWNHGGSSGDFSWSYPMRSPDMPGGLGPDLSLGYSSQSVDGRTTSTNNQTSWLGEGWSGLEPGFVERRYIGCADDTASGANNDDQTGDLCWKQENAVLSLGGSTSELVKDSSTGVWRPKNDDGSRVERLTGAGNGARNGEYWRVTTTDGVQYYFGKHTRYAGDTAATNSVLTVPVAGNHSSEPCHASAFADSFCDQAYRWNLDYVVDPNGNTMTYFYTRESNRYGQNLNDESVSYHRGSYLRRVEYGQRKGSEHSTPAPARVVFTTAERCLTDCGELTEGTAENWPDVPYDLICTSTSSCSDRYAPAFFSRKRLTQVETQVRVSGTYQAVDRWTLEQDFPDPGDDTSAALWLESVQHSGRAGTAVTLPKVTFDGQQMPNRVDGLEGAPPLIKYRMRSIKSETGAVVAVNYSATECTPATVPTPHTNTKLCFPVYWNFEGSGETDPQVHWFHKYVVDSITETDGTGDGVDVEHYYTYGSSPAWAYNDDPFTDEDYRTWGQWRGYSKVTTRTGHPSAGQLRTEALYFRGLHGDRLSPTGGTKTVAVTDSWGDSVTDREEWAGMLREEIVYDGSSKVSSTVNDMWRSAVTADDGDTQARKTNLAATRVHTSLAAGGWRTTETQYSYDTHGLLVEANDRGDISTTSDDLCTRTEYAKNTSAWIVDTVKRTETVSVRCPASPSRPADVVSDQRFFYDGGAYGAAPTKGNVTRTQELDEWDGGPKYVATEESDYDALGRVTASRDALGREARTVYTPSSGGPLTKTVVTNAAGHVETTVLDPRLSEPTRVTDANGLHTDLSYDGMGRLTGVWLTDRDKASESASIEFAYRVSDVAPVAVTTKSLLPSGGYATRVELYDSLLRPRQTQSPAQWNHGGRVIDMSEYDSRGLVTDAKGPFFSEGNPSTTLVEPDGGESAPRQVETTFDGAGRVTLERLLVHLEEHSRRTTSYGGDRVSVTPPEGGTATMEITDARGNVTEVRHYHGGQPSGSYDALDYTWTPSGEVETASDAGGNTWSYTYDLRGRQVRVDDPDAGTSTTVYDAVGQVVETTDARGETVTYGYDELGRETSTADGQGTVLAEWTYDTLAKGQLSSHTRFHDGDAYTTSVYDYDDGYRSLGETVTIPASEGALAGEYTSYRTYEVDGSPRYRSFPRVGGLMNETLQWLYDSAGNPNRLGGFDAYVSETEYSPYGEVMEYALRAFTPRVTQSFAYETGTRRLSDMVFERGGVDPADVQVAYSYDEAGNPLSVVDSGREAGVGDVQCFTYDHLRRVTGAWSQTTESCAPGPGSATLGGPAPYGQSYSYDVVGNRTELVDHVADTVTSYVHPAAGQPGPHTLAGMTVADGGGVEATSFDYDEAGNTTAVESTSVEGDSTYAWDVEGNLATAVTEAGVSEFVYDANGDRLLRRTADAVTLYVFGDEITLGTDGSVSAERYYEFNGDTIGMHEAPTVDWRDTELVFLGADLWGTPSVAVRQSSMDITVRRQDPFGGPRGGFDLSLWPGDRGFHTGTNDPATGLVHMGARYYQPNLGRFLSVDPLIDHFDPEQIHGYAYANNNPMAFSDPTGLWPGFVDKIKDTVTSAASAATKFVVDNADTISAVAGTAAIVASFVPGGQLVAVGLGAVAAGAGAIDAGTKAAAGDWGGAAVSAVGFIPGVRGAHVASKAWRAGKAAREGNRASRAVTRTERKLRNESDRLEFQRFGCRYPPCRELPLRADESIKKATQALAAAHTRSFKSVIPVKRATPRLQAMKSLGNQWNTINASVIAGQQAYNNSTTSSSSSSTSSSGSSPSSTYRPMVRGDWIAV